MEKDYQLDFVDLNLDALYSNKCVHTIFREGKANDTPKVDENISVIMIGLCSSQIEFFYLRDNETRLAPEERPIASTFNRRVSDSAMTGTVYNEARNRFLLVAI